MAGIVRATNLRARIASLTQLPRPFFKPLAIGAPAPLRELPVRLERMIHFVPPHIEKITRQGAGADPRRSTWCSAIWRTRFPPTPRRRRARASSRWRKAIDFGATGLWTRINALNSPWALDDITEIVAAIGNKLDVMMLPKVEGAVGHPLSRPAAGAARGAPRGQEADPDPRHPGDRARASTMSRRSRPPRPRMHGIILGPADLAASRAHEDHARRRRPSGLRGAGRRARSPAAKRGETRAAFQQDLWHYTIAKMVDACAAAGIKPFYGPFGDFSDPAACEAQFRNAFLMGCAGAWTLHPSQIAIAKRVFSPDPAEVRSRRRFSPRCPTAPAPS